ncbi:uncharacterized protein LOC126739609 [Anthonomus grandis grandis]|uniref:uncharacterized protein LOC126739609 n=1 Tax=Anthonomus grandis grandis TaxID=2921223 RepID=UPI002165B7A5|nr:uncharacterized protein LOC126739609 [Anthonomus grandis grandis]
MKLVVTVLCAALFAQALGGTLGSGKDEAKSALEKLLAVIDKALTEAQSTLDKAMTTVNEKVTEVTSSAKGELDKVLEPLQTKLDDLVATATAAGFDVTLCQDYIDKFSNIPNDMVDNLGSCITAQVSKAQSYVDDALNNAKAMETSIASLDTDIDNCSGNAIKKAKCYAKIIEEIAKDTSSAPQHIVEDVAKATALVTEIIPTLETCSINQVKKAGEDAAEDVANFAICAAV